jgi:hypothetical protein
MMFIQFHENMSTGSKVIWGDTCISTQHRHDPKANPSSNWVTQILQGNQERKCQHQVTTISVDIPIPCMKNSEEIMKKFIGNQVHRKCMSCTHI